MAGPDRTLSDSIIEELAKNPFAFDFYRAVRLLEARHPGFPRIGHSVSPSQDPIRFGQKPSLTFAPSTLDSFVLNGDRAAPRLFTNFFGVFGPNGPLPLHLTEYAYERDRHFDDRTLMAFANLFHHRFFSFFYRAWAASQKTVDLDRSDDRRYSIYIGSLFGIGMDSLQTRDAVPDSAKLYYSGRLSCQTRNAEGLEAILQDYFHLRTEVQTFFGRWLDLPADSACELGDSPESGSLGLTTVVGSRIWDCQLSFRIRMGPMKFGDYERMLPNGDSFKRLRHWVRNYLGDQLLWDAQLVLLAGEVPSISLGQTGRLGWTTWLKTAPLGCDPDDLVIVGD